LRNWLAVGTFVLVLASSSANANVYNVDFTGIVEGSVSFNLDAKIVTGGAVLGDPGGYYIDNITGTVTSTLPGFGTQTITGLIPTSAGTPIGSYFVYYAPSGNGWYYNNIFYPSGSPNVDFYGPLFTTGSPVNDYLNLYTIGSSYYLSVDNPQPLWDPGDPAVTTLVTSTPLPSTWVMLIVGFVGLLGFLAFGGKKRKVAATAAAWT
jgi:hypothetical protein